MALHPKPCVSHRSRTAGIAAQYVPRNGTAPRIAAKASERLKEEKQQNIIIKTITKQQNLSISSSYLKICTKTSSTNYQLKFPGNDTPCLMKVKYLKT